MNNSLIEKGYNDVDSDVEDLTEAQNSSKLLNEGLEVTMKSTKYVR